MSDDGKKCRVCGVKFGDGIKTDIENPICYMCSWAEEIDNPRKKPTNPNYNRRPRTAGEWFRSQSRGRIAGMGMLFEDYSEESFGDIPRKSSGSRAGIVSRERFEPSEVVTYKLTDEELARYRKAGR